MHKEDAELVAVHSRADCQTYTGRCCAQIGMQYWTRLIGMMDWSFFQTPTKTPVQSAGCKVASCLISWLLILFLHAKLVDQHP